MSTRTKDSTIHIDGKRVAAGLAQAGSFTTTWLFIAAIGIDGISGFLVAVAVEFILFAGKNLVLGDNAHSDAVGWAAILLDTVLNAGGLWPYITKLDKTPSWVMLVESLQLDGTLRQVPALVLALVFGFLLSVAPHRLWFKK